jgi:hypothetical protein
MRRAGMAGIAAPNERPFSYILERFSGEPAGTEGRCWEMEEWMPHFVRFGPRRTRPSGYFGLLLAATGVIVIIIAAAAEKGPDSSAGAHVVSPDVGMPLIGTLAGSE